MADITTVKLNPEVFIGELTQQGLIDAYRTNWKTVENSLNQLFASSSSTGSTTLNALSGAVVLQENGTPLVPSGQNLNVVCVQSLNALTGVATVTGTNNAVVSTAGSAINVDGLLAPGVKLVLETGSSHTIIATDYMIRFTVSTTPSLGFPAAASVPNKIVRIILLTGATLSISAFAGDTVEAWPLTKYTEWVSDGGTNWYVVLDK